MADPKVKVTLHLSPEAAEILSQYAGERNRGFFVSQLLLALRHNDDLEGERLFTAMKAVQSVGSAEGLLRAGGDAVLE